MIEKRAIEEPCRGLANKEWSWLKELRDFPASEWTTMPIHDNVTEEMPREWFASQPARTLPAKRQLSFSSHQVAAVFNSDENAGKLKFFEKVGFRTLPA
jgi:hypothetical protein